MKSNIRIVAVNSKGKIKYEYLKIYHDIEKANQKLKELSKADRQNLSWKLLYTDSLFFL